MTHTPTLAPCTTCGSQAAAYLAPAGVGYLIECSNADCHSRHAAKGIVAHTSAQGAAAKWNQRQGVDGHGTHVRISPAHHVGSDSAGNQVGESGKATQISQQAKGARHV